MHFYTFTQYSFCCYGSLVGWYWLYELLCFFCISILPEAYTMHIQYESGQLYLAWWTNNDTTAPRTLQDCRWTSEKTTPFFHPDDSKSGSVNCWIMSVCADRLGYDNELKQAHHYAISVAVIVHFMHAVHIVTHLQGKSLTLAETHCLPEKNKFSISSTPRDVQREKGLLEAQLSTAHCNNLVQFRDYHCHQR